MVMEVVVEDMGDGSMQCTIHPYKNSTPAGGICAFCLQEKLGKLVSSSFPVAIFPSASLSSSPSVRSEFGSNNTTTATTASSTTATTTNESNNSSTKPSRLPFLLAESNKKKKKKKGGVISVSDSASIVFKRSKSTTTPRHAKFVGVEGGGGEVYGHHKGRFWSFLYPTTSTSSSSNKHPTANKNERNYCKDVKFASSSSSSSKREELIVIEEMDHNRKVSRSRSVGCGSRSFSGDFFERISTGLGDCTVLRRVESQREAKPKNHNNNGQECIKERVKCGGIFGGFAITSSSSAYWVSTSSNEDDHVINGKNLAHGRSKSWGWALMASPMRAFTAKPSTTIATGKKEAQTNKNPTPNLAAVPSLLAVRT